MKLKKIKKTLVHQIVVQMEKYAQLLEILMILFRVLVDQE